MAGEHWYSLDGEPVYEVEKNGGGLRPTTIRDARKLKLVPSVTTVMNILAKPGLDYWKMEQAVYAAKSNRQFRNEEDKSYAARIIGLSKEETMKAAARGTAIHDALEMAYLGEEYDSGYNKLVQGVQQAILQNIGDYKWKAEESFGDIEGYGGKVDLHCDEWVVDFKTKEFDEDKLPKLYDEHAMQLGAYRQGLRIPNANGAIVFVSASNPGLVHVEVLKEDALQRGTDIFNSILATWKLIKKYDPKEV